MNIFEVNEVDQKIDKYNQLIHEQELPFDLVAVNKYYTSAIIFNREKECLHYVETNRGYIKVERLAPGYGNSFGSNFILIDQRFSKYESIELTNKKRQYTTCARYELEKYLSEGWEIENRR